MKETDAELELDNWIEYAPDDELAQKLSKQTTDTEERRRIEEQLAHRASWRSMTDEQRKAELDKMQAHIDALTGLGGGGMLNRTQASAFVRTLIAVTDK